MNTCFRSSVAALAFFTLAFADDAPFLQTPPEVEQRIGTEKSLHADKTPPASSSPEQSEWTPRILGSAHDQNNVVRLYVLNVIPNPGHLKPVAGDVLQQIKEVDDGAVAGRVQVGSSEGDDDGAIAGHVRLASGEADHVLPNRDPQQPFAQEVSVFSRNLTIEGPLEVAVVAQDSRRQFEITPVPVVPAPLMPNPVMPVPPDATSSDVVEAAAGDLRPDALKSLAEIRLSDLKPQGDPEDSSRPVDRAHLLTEGRLGMLDMTPPPPRYVPRRNSYPIRHNPLYFEDPNLERCGLGHGCLTDAASLVCFAGRLPILTYMMTVDPPHSCVRAKPDCPTCHGFGLDAYVPNPGELDVAAAALHAAVVVGVIFFIP